jgi:DNA polymerase-4
MNAESQAAMQRSFNHAQPLIMHIDLNSCFATVEQQAHIHLRHKPIVIAAYTSPKAFILAPSIEAKALGIKMGMRVWEAQKIYPQVVVRTPDAPLIRDVHIKFRTLLSEYSPDIAVKSIDELVLNFATVTRYHGTTLEAVGQEIKHRIRTEIGDWLRCSVGIGTNRFLAKTAASFRKPDGLTTITSQNALAIYQQLELIDLHGINVRYQARLNRQGIKTCWDFLHASPHTLTHAVFKSVHGYRWYQRLRGWEVDDVSYGRKSFGQQYALGKKTADTEELRRIIMKLCEKMGRRLRRHHQAATGIHLALRYDDHTYWHQGVTFSEDLYATVDLYHKAMTLFGHQPAAKCVSLVSVSCFGLHNYQQAQLPLFATASTKRVAVAQALDKINNTYGEFTIIPARMMAMDDTIVDRIAFGGVG